MGRPLSIRSEGENKVYVYRDTLAGYGEMTFTVDSQGIIRDWDATNNIQGVFGGDVFGAGDAGVLDNPYPSESAIICSYRRSPLPSQSVAYDFDASNSALTTTPSRRHSSMTSSS